VGEEIPEIGEDYTFREPALLRGRITFGAIPWLMHDRPFIQGLEECASTGEAMAKAAENPHPDYAENGFMAMIDRASLPQKCGVYSK
jgi:uncharacterized NAD(P)/FAD-binding protein YdhS